MKTQHIVYIGIGAALAIGACDMPTSHTCMEDRTCWPEAGAAGSGGSEDGGTSSAAGSAGTGNGLGGSGAAGAPIMGGTAGRGSAGAAGVATGGTLPCNGACSGATPICQAASNRCVGCTEDGHCSATTPVCDLTLHACVACTKDANCPAATPACKLPGNVCVGCTSKAQCSASKGVCAADNTCVECLSSSDCTYSAAKPACKTGTKTCVECVTSADCKDPTKTVCDTSPTSTTPNTCVGCLENSDCKDAAKPQCNAATKACVACLSNTDCKTAGASKCDVTAGSPTVNTCLPCSADADCTQVTGKTACLIGTASAQNQCVQCTVANETACGANSCNPKTNGCSSTARGSRKTCYSCVADSECGTTEGAVDPNSRCVPMTFNGAAHGTGGYCLQRASSSAGCSNPYSVPISAASLSGAIAENYCGINQAATTCEAILDLFASKTCGADTECGGGNGGLCKAISIVLPANRCTIPCISTAECLQSPAPGSTCSNTTAGWCQ